MKHAGPEALDQLEEVLERVRKHESLRERKRGAFYLKSQGFLHFHEDPAGLFADLKIGTRYERFRVTTKAERLKLVAKIHALLKRQT
ncbi:MAG TPA: hypothetical protein VKM94_14215 [Blastocatellia bacterium]|nr:hypothetical protein [Blastocatellia bacterium]